jgi:predicted nucleotidyltransferase/uncharacterized protein (UPF0332 family)
MQALAEAQLTMGERAALDALVRRLERAIGDGLLAVWLYGSRARGDAHEDSDIDVMAVVDDLEQHATVRRIVDEVERDAATYVDIRTSVQTPETLADKYAIELFYIHNVERDRVVLYGPPGGEIAGLEDLIERARDRYAQMELPVKPRSWRLVEQARRYQRVLAAVEPLDVQAAVGEAYSAALFMARAALSEEDVEARRHGGTWAAFRRVFVDTGRFPEELARGSSIQKVREKAVYSEHTVPDEQAREAIADARRFIAEVETILGLEPPEQA